MRRIIVLAALGALAVPLAPAPGQPYGGYSGLADADARYNALIDGWCQKYLRRPSDPSSNLTWVRMMESGTAPETILATILGSAEYYNAAGGDDGRYAARLIAEVTGRRATPREMDHLLDRLRREDRTQAVYAFLTVHPEGLQGNAPPPVPAYEYRRGEHRDYDHDRWDERRDRRDR